MEMIRMKKYVLLKTLKERKAGQIVLLDENNFFSMYWVRKGVITPLQQDNPLNIQDKDKKELEQPKKAVKKGKKKK